MVEEGDGDKEQTTTSSSASVDEGSNSIVSSCAKPNIVNPASDAEANALPHAYPWMVRLMAIVMQPNANLLTLPAAYN